VEGELHLWPVNSISNGHPQTHALCQSFSFNLHIRKPTGFQMSSTTSQSAHASCMHGSDSGVWKRKRHPYCTP
jgi:hypothetical protein